MFSRNKEVQRFFNLMVKTKKNGCVEVVDISEMDTMFTYMYDTLIIN